MDQCFCVALQPLNTKAFPFFLGGSISQTFPRFQIPNKKKKKKGMAYRRRQGITRATTFKEEIYKQPPKEDAKGSKSFSSSNSSLAAQAIRASSAFRDSPPPLSQVRGFNAYEDPSKNENRGFWGILAQKAKAILEDDDVIPQLHLHPSNESSPLNDRKVDNPKIRKSLDKLTFSLNQMGESFEKAFEEGRTLVENKAADIIQETRRLQIRRKGSDADTENQSSGGNSPWQPLVLNPTIHESQLKASRDVAMATAAKAKLLLRELKTLKADLAFAKERCAQLEEENRRLRDSREKGNNPADDDLIRLQLETLLAEKARLAHENSIYARENRFLREIVEYHQLTMQDVVYIDDGIEEVAEVNPSITRTLSLASFAASDSHSILSSPSSLSSPPRLSDIYPPANDEENLQPIPPPSVPHPVDVKRPPPSHSSA
ncbi:PREDICTED: uncharacterized protein LOC104806656 [Tarenaya hassleriana]|uniref:uncharacterized protein LOC104806656 n=1 Tax=Tarenaya hassleriana TaxID=28532 RepID=UPI00053C888E|nr:PREDICTED: uncharacterized protein LOC104806656 [Tarenaya hassleriana]